ncbi:uncharacterized protein BCR38DRAFT_491050 [Pseudomassariella vexata]|uniref:DNA2/NAM7 helicase helicase domain-containing protein n=1 Tax=Pseudomassariella vexata TaxID=1141098 RepID=A0A1Y2D8X1_9PEZI|nr:uncharacterized protein BCR38DRAFT_491050 [Pseudomassariella vexata]ORY55709.1 hypothetical protein BCR38DRAFT_491050 [Pseudomassariella vexata]
MQQAVLITSRDLQYAALEAAHAHDRRAAQPYAVNHDWIQSMFLPMAIDCEEQFLLNPEIFRRQFFDQKLNWEQKKAVESICLQDYCALSYLVLGPPGTEKTRTLIKIALQLV